MKNRPQKKITLKIVIGYLSMALLVLIIGVFIKTELKSYLSMDRATENDKILLSVNEFLAAIYQGEQLSKMALSDQTRRSFRAYAAKVDTLTTQIDKLKPLVKTVAQRKMFDSVQVLLHKKLENTRLLHQLQIQNEKNTSIDSVMEEFNRVELSLGRIIPEKLVTNFDELSIKTQNTIKEYASLLNQNIPENNKTQRTNQKIDSVIVALREILKQAKETQLESKRSLLQREIRIARNDLKLSGQLQQLVSTIEQEVYKDTQESNQQRQALLQRSAKWIGLLALISLGIVVLFTFLISRDFWKVQRYRKALEQEKQYSESLLKSREQLITTVSHDLRTPLNTIMGYTELCKQAASGAVQSQHLAHISAASDYVASLVNDLLDFSRLEAGQIKINKKPFVLAELIKLTAAEHQKKYSSKPIELAIEIHRDLATPIFGDPLRIKQVLNNLISNAFKFTERGFVKVAAIPCSENKKKPLLEIKVSDSGIGIKKEEQERIFQEFVQSAEETEKKYIGYGLGLAISRRLATLLNGDLLIESEEGLGSHFTLVLPLEFAKEKWSLPKKTTATRLQGTTILIFDDDPAHLELLTVFCRRLSIQVIALQHFEALHPHDTFTYDVVLTDIQMPKKDGFQVLKALQKGSYAHYTSQPIIAMTGRQDISKAVYLKAGFSSVLRKPFSFEELILVLEQALMHPHNTAHKVALKASTKIPSNECLFDLSYFSSFLGDEQEGVGHVLKTFLKETSINIQRINTYIVSGAIDKVSFTAHRMLPMFYHLKAVRLIPILEELEHLEQGITMEELQIKAESLEQEFKLMEKAVVKVLAKHPYCID